MIFQLSDWFPKPMIWAIIVKFDQIRKNWWPISCAEILEVGKNFSAASSVKEMSRFEELSSQEIKRIAWKFTKTVVLLRLAGYELIIYISSYPVRPRRITANDLGYSLPYFYDIKNLTLVNLHFQNKDYIYSLAQFTLGIEGWKKIIIEY